jgi:mono/diheme cytochrome c family protein
MVAAAILPVFLQAETIPSDVAGLLDRYCYSCHGPKKQKAKLNLARYTDSAAILAARDIWLKAAEMVAHGEMPDEDPKPSDDERKRLADWIEATVNDVDWQAVRRPGAGHVGRLTRREYRNSVRDLLGVDLHPHRRLTEDGQGPSGFSNDSAMLTVTPDLAEAYIAAADRALGGLIALDEPPLEVHFESEALMMTETTRTAVRLSADFFGYTLTRGQMTLYESLTFPADGYYTFTIRAQSGLADSGVIVRIDNDKVGEMAVPTGEARVYAVTAFVEGGFRQVAWNVSPAPQQAKSKERGTAVLIDPAAEIPRPVSVDWVRIAGPVRPLALKSPFTALDESRSHAHAHQIISDFARRAFRRPISSRDTRRYRTLYDNAVAANNNAQKGLRMALGTILSSPHFLYRNESPASGTGTVALDAYQLATRLSYFLWQSAPDDALLAAAASGQLLQPEELIRQTRRLLKDPRRRQFTETFTGEWLKTGALGGAVRPDPLAFPAFDDALSEAMKSEVVLGFEHLLDSNGNLLELIDSDHTWLNERLATHYGIAGVSGDSMRRVALKDPVRGGLLGSGAVLTTTSTPVRSSPVVRGVWVLETLLGEKVPEAPADAGALPGNAGQRAGRTLRDELIEHRRNAKCAACHDKMDPLGFGLETFDAIGRYRKEQSGKPIDTAGKLPDGTSFAGPVELKKWLRTERSEAFVRNVTERLLAFALGRKLQYYDEATIRDVIAAATEGGFAARTLIEAIVVSETFTHQYVENE